MLHNALQCKLCHLRARLRQSGTWSASWPETDNLETLCASYALIAQSLVSMFIYLYVLSVLLVFAHAHVKLSHKHLPRIDTESS